MANNNKLDLVTSDLFNDQLTLGLLTVLENTAGVRNVTVKQSLPCDKAKIGLWEHRNACLLPDDLRSFYASCDGFKLTWSYRVEGITSDVTAAAIGGASNLPIGNITVNPLSDLVRLCDVNTDTVNVNVMRDLQLLDRLSDRNTPDFTENSKIFELDSIPDVGQVCLVYPDGRAAAASRPEEHPREEPNGASVWLLDTSYRWHFLAPNFSNYFRKALVHMGLPHWQLKFTDMGLTSIGEFFMNLVAPQLNVTNRVPAIGQLDDDEQSTTDSISLNHIDPCILKTMFKMSKSKKNANK
ncbi:tubulin polyglutamylase complex subunit 2-like [Acyrthosiphon pisum]|uniref:Tubulin polyglutamylase complex subunit 2 n=1 Tax=Acyrthosiphon pisum TaxID=7029 RepID=A0A8R1W839_ACYPI|nr:tubulin polyglutamylase complex subunit 2-like [Acyrthosiphon pisum]|eukprot:XP_003240263.1 PREDICTED: tubulin polyglutamylase complex subunit 2-like [Acyrthosiphon pisum]